MLLNYDTLQKYELDINLLKSIYRKSITDNLDYFFIENWLNVLEFYYINNKASIIKYNNEPQFFQKSIELFDKIKFYLHFDINKAESIISNYEINTMNPHKVPNNLIYNKSQYSDIHIKSNKPIIVISFPLKNMTDELVIDGNHRISAKMDSGLDIPYIKFNDEDSIRTIPQYFEIFYYQFMLDYRNYSSYFPVEKRKQYIKSSSYLRNIIKIE